MPAAPKTKTTDKPNAAGKAQEPPKAVGVAQVADKLGTDGRTLRAFLRRTERSVGRGTRYSWSSLSDPAVKKIMADFQAAKAEPDQD